ncbi:MAG: small, acid-soluble spore protein, alpha/beta type [Terrisporobacter othiniensis]|uniref:small, acid-soluble spore protein, alpha/beta type n=1 Tax=Terrisporobacter petrolearius TaxID=1460447 RepID=UPI0022E83E5A|nr:small, acid-soluble spore protein, alpha/beta type [Terrisporobacter petrolearius]MDU4862162.1 small, acid-soluble spore protein, alpha/beta type [Terrisporobacter othiniensis]MDU6995761.1 small, acid-soluble spore protein, alpha/beta type [Terrisporobacter othiniensis]
MSKPVDPNAKLALNQMKMEISKELLNDSNMKNDSNPIDSIGLSGRVGGQMSKKLVEMGERELLKRYNK